MFRIVKKPELSPGRAVAAQLFAVVAALLAAAVIVALLGYNPFEFYGNLVKGALGSVYRVREQGNSACYSFAWHAYCV